MKFKNEHPLTTWSLRGWNPICSLSWEMRTSPFTQKDRVSWRLPWPTVNSGSGTTSLGQSPRYADGETEAKHRGVMTPGHIASLEPTPPKKPCYPDFQVRGLSTTPQFPGSGVGKTEGRLRSGPLRTPAGLRVLEGRGSGEAGATGCHRRCSLWHTALPPGHRSHPGNDRRTPLGPLHRV